LEGTTEDCLDQPRCSKQGQLQQVAQGFVTSWVLNLSKNGHSTCFLGNPFQCLTSLTVKKFIWGFLIEFPVFVFVPISSCHITGHRWEESGSIFLTSPHERFTPIDKIPLRFLFSRLKDPSSLSFPLKVRCFYPSVIFVALC